MKMFKLSVLLVVAIVTTSQALLAAAIERPAIANLVDTSSTAGAVSSASVTHNSYPASKAFDKNKTDGNGRWLATKSNNMYLVYKFNEPTLVNGLTVVAGHDNKGGYNSAGRAPKSWTFEGSNDGEAWTILDTQTSETGWTNGEERYYSFTNGQTYKYYKYNCTALNGAEDYLQLWELEFYCYNPTHPIIGESSLVHSGSLSYTITTMLEVNSGDVYWIADDGSKAYTNLIQEALAEGASVDGTISSLPENKTYQISVFAENSEGTSEEFVDFLYYGALSLGETYNADENGYAAGGVIVSRANPDPWPLTINYSISATTTGAEEGVTWEAPKPVIIPANETSVMLPVNPLVDANVDEDIQVTISLEAGNYELPAVATASITLLNLTFSDDYNTWCAKEAGLASEPRNWSLGRAPIASDRILFDGRISSASCTWDVATSVASWSQIEGYTGTITFMTTYPDLGFEQFVIAGDAVIDSGIWTHSENSDTEVYRLAVSVGGDLTLAATASIDVRLKGFAAKKYYPGAAAGQHAGGKTGGSVYGDIYEPINLGSGYNSAGGGAVHLVVKGDAVLEGLITTQSQKGSSDGNGAPGSIYIKANTISGEGEILANSNSGRCSGGRISLVVTGDNKLAKSRDKLNAQGTFAGVRGGAGTILVKTTAETYGILYIDNPERTNYFINHYPEMSEITAIPTGSNWIVDGIVFAHEGILGIHEGTTLTLPNGFASVNGSSWRAGIVYNGGTIVAADADEVTDTATIQGKWVFQANEQFVFPGNLIVKDEGAVGCVRLRQITNVVYGCDIKVDGDMTVEETGFMYADVTGHSHKGYDFLREYYGDAYAYGGQLAMSTNGVYGSILNPNMPGSYGGANDGNDQNLGGGLIKVTVEGTLALDGKATAIGGQLDNVRGTGGAINITAGNLTGAGSIAAHGYSVNTTPSGPTNNNNSDIKTLAGVRSHRNVKAASPGGRVAIRLTDKDATLSEHWSAVNSILAYGGNFTNSTTKAIDELYSASAGTIYIQEGDEEEGAGTIYVYNNGLVDNPAFTPIPSVKYNDGEDLSKTSLYAGAAGKVRICQEELKLNILTVEETSVIDLFGSTLSVTRAKIGGKSLGAGVYEPSDFADNLVDTSEAGGGTIVVLGEGTLILLR